VGFTVFCSRLSGVDHVNRGCGRQTVQPLLPGANSFGTICLIIGRGGHKCDGDVIRRVGKAGRARSSLGGCNRNGAVEQEAKIKEELPTQGRSGYLTLEMDGLIRRRPFSRSETSALYTHPDCQQTLRLGHVANVYTADSSDYPDVTVWLRACTLRILVVPTHLMSRRVWQALQREI
jgi:hypothetical protein